MVAGAGLGIPIGAEASSAPTVLFASATGSPSDACTSSDPCDLATALADVSSGGMILLTTSGDEGDDTTWYEGNFSVATSVTVTPAPGVSAPILDGQSTGSVITIEASAVTFAISDVTIQDGDATESGGGIENFVGGTVDVTGVTFSNNVAQAAADQGGGGGAIDNRGSGVLTVTGSTFIDNSVDQITDPNHASKYGGGAIDNAGNYSAATATISDSTFVGNVSSGGGTAIYAGNQYGGGTVTLTSSTFASGQTVVNGNNRGSSRIIVAGNVFGGSCGEGTGATPAAYWEDDGYNVGSASCFGASYTGLTGSGTNGPGDVTDNTVATELGSLADNGGPTQTMALQAGSGAIGVIPDPQDVTTDGSQTLTLCPTVDQRGYLSPTGTACDAGAVQSAGIAPSTPTVTAVSPTAGLGAGGDSVTITGTGFTGATVVEFGGVPTATFAVDSDTSITATAPTGSGVADVTVTAPGGTSTTSSADRYTYVPVPAVSGVSPATGAAAGGGSVTIAGTGFTGATVVEFGSVSATFSVDSDTSITATVPAGSGVADVTVTTPGGTSVTGSADHYTYVPAPVVSGVSPTTGAAAGGDTVTITGTGFTGATGVEFGSRSATFTVDSDTSITATVPAGSGVVDVTVTGAGGTSATGTDDQFTYDVPPKGPDPAPTVTGVAPAVGPASGGGTVTLTGTGLGDVSAVDFGSTAALGFTLVSETTLTAVVPAGEGVVDVTVVAPAGTSSTSAADQYTYTTVPTLARVQPAAGPTAGGGTVTITGTGFTAGTTVAFGALPATSVTVVSPTVLTATVPAQTWGRVDVTVTTLGGTSATSVVDRYRYQVVPRIARVLPASGPVRGGTTVTIVGSGFVHATTVWFGRTPGRRLQVLSPTRITVVVPRGTRGRRALTVTTPGGTSAARPAAHYTYAGR